MTKDHFAHARDGTPIRYLIQGAPSATRRVALVHSLAMTAEFWDGVAAALAEGWQVLAVDCRGHGVSGKPPGPYSVELLADDLLAVLTHAGWGRVVVGGASMGGCIAMAFAARHAARVAGLALIDTTAWYGPDAARTWEDRAQRVLAGGMTELIGFQKTRWFSDAFRAANPEQVEAAVAIFLRNDVAAYAEACRMLGRCDLRAVLSRFAFPVQVVVGEKDYATPVTMAEALALEIPGAALTVLPGARHFTPLERPAEVAGRISMLAR